MSRLLWWPLHQQNDQCLDESELKTIQMPPSILFKDAVSKHGESTIAETSILEEAKKAQTYSSQLQVKVRALREKRARSVFVILVERIIIHPIVLSGLAVIYVYSGIVLHVKSYSKNQTLKHTYVQSAVINNYKSVQILFVFSSLNFLEKSVKVNNNYYAGANYCQIPTFFHPTPS